MCVWMKTERQRESEKGKRGDRKTIEKEEMEKREIEGRTNRESRTVKR